MAKFAGVLAVAVAGFLTIGAAQAGTIFDSQALTAATPGETVSSETRSNGSNYAAVLQFAQTVTVNQIGIFTAVDQAQDVKFLIFDSAYNGGGSGSVLFSQVKSFAANATQQFIYTDPIAFTFQAGRTYDVGILGSAGVLTGAWSYASDLTANGVTEISRNANFTNYASPTTGNYSGVTPFIQLNTVETVPEPSSWAMMAVGLAALGFAVRRRANQAG